MCCCFSPEKPCSLQLNCLVDKPSLYGSYAHITAASVTAHISFSLSFFFPRERRVSRFLFSRWWKCISFLALFSETSKNSLAGLGLERLGDGLEVALVGVDCFFLKVFEGFFSSSLASSRRRARRFSRCCCSRRAPKIGPRRSAQLNRSETSDSSSLRIEAHRIPSVACRRGRRERRKSAPRLAR